MNLPEENKNNSDSLVHREKFDKFSKSVSCIIALFLIGCIVGLYVWLFI
jgi:hypothetical protein